MITGDMAHRRTTGVTRRKALFKDSSSKLGLGKELFQQCFETVHGVVAYYFFALE
jgi:hypothetical protein